MVVDTTIHSTDVSEVDHIKPKAEGGSDSIQNKQLLHGIVSTKTERPGLDKALDQLRKSAIPVIWKTV